VDRGAERSFRQTAQMDPTGLSSPIGQLVIAAGLISTIVVLIMLLRRRR